MIVISNHVKKIGMKLPSETVIRINVAWVKTKEELVKIIEENEQHDIWVDYPTGRTKPPRPTLTIAEAISVLHDYNNIKYFAFSNGSMHSLCPSILYSCFIVLYSSKVKTSLKSE